MSNINLNIEPKEYFERPSSQGFWYDLECCNEDKFLNIIEDEETREYFKKSYKTFEMVYQWY